MNKKSTKYLLFSTMLLGSFITTPITILASETDQTTTSSDVTEASKEITENSILDSLNSSSQQGTVQSQETTLSSQVTENSNNLNSVTEYSTNSSIQTNSNKKSSHSQLEETYDLNYMNTYFEGYMQEDNSLFVITGVKKLKSENNLNKLVLPSILINSNVKTKVKVTSSFWENVKKLKMQINEFTIKKIDNYEVSCIESRSLANIFDGATQLYTVNLEGYDYTNIVSTRAMFQNCQSLTYVNLNADSSTSSITNVENMFYQCLKLRNIDGIENANMSSVTSMYGMFYQCQNLQNIGNNNNILNWNTSNVYNMSYLFNNTLSLKKIDISSFDVSNVENASYMFGASGIVELDMSNFNFSRCTDMNNMFSYTNYLKKLDMTNVFIPENANIRQLFFVNSYNEMLIISNNKRLLSYNYPSQNRYPIWKPNLNANGGIFSNNNADISYIGKVCMPAEQLTMENFEEWKNKQIPTKEGNYHFMEWIPSREVILDSNLLDNLDVEYTARWVYSDWNFELDPIDQTYKLTRYIGNNKNVIIPAEIDGKPTKIDLSSGFESDIEKNSITSISFPETNGKRVRLIGNKILFEDWIGLQQFDATGLDTSYLTNLENAFKGCSALVSVDFSNCNLNSVKNMNSMFENTDHLKFVNFSNTQINSDSTMLNMFKVLTKKELLIATENTTLNSYDYSNDKRNPYSMPVLDGNRGTFSNEKKQKDVLTKKSYFDSVCAPYDKLSLSSFKNWIMNNTPILERNTFKGWSFSKKPEEITNIGDLFDVTFTAQWLPDNSSTTNDNEVNSVESDFGIAYQPQQFNILSTNLNDKGNQEIAFDKQEGFHIGVRDDSKTNWILTAKLTWSDAYLENVTIKTGNATGEVKKNISTGISDIKPTDLENSNNEAIGKVNVEIGSTPVEIMKSNTEKKHIGVYDYNLGEVKLNIPNVENVPASTYTGKVIWNLAVTP